MPLTRDEVADRIKQARENAQLTQDQLANLAGMERSALGKVEIGARSLSGQEIERIAYALGRNPLELLSSGPMAKDALSLFRSVTDDNSDENRRTVANCVALLREARQLERYLGYEEPDIPQAHTFGRMSNFSEAVLQGRTVARLERDRMGLGTAPIPDMADLINQQGIRAAALPMCEEVSGLFIQDEALGTAILVNQNVSRVRADSPMLMNMLTHCWIDMRRPNQVAERTRSSCERQGRTRSLPSSLFQRMGFLVSSPA